MRIFIVGGILKLENKMITMRDGKKIYVRVYENGHKNTLLYLHGGPGQSCNTFQYQAKQLSSYMNVILFDQRGVLRSDKIEENDVCGIDTLLNDCEDLRKALQIDKWSVLGHSFGGYLALLYASQYPQYVEKVVFENPGFNFLEAIKTIYRKGIRVLKDKGFEATAKELEDYLLNNNDIKKLVNDWGNVQEDIRTEVYYNKQWSEMPEEERLMNYVTDVTDEQWANGIIHYEKIMSDPKIYENNIHLIKQINCPSLLLRGEYDPVLSNEYQDYYINNAPNGKIAVIKDCGHFIHSDKPEEFTKVVGDFINVKIW